MGGKDKQRTKGNLKPSSSGRAAELMAKGGNVGFVGFDGLGSPGEASLGYVPMATGGRDDVDSTVDGDFRMTMRKLMKRDGVTKLKAVQEFTELCKNLPTEAVESALPFWPRLYNKLAVDNDHRVREATQQAMEQMVLRVRRNLAPHLRAVVGSWLCCQFDTYAPVASAAQRAFSAAFSEEKQAEAIMFCKKELVEFFQDNILNQSPTTLSDPKFVPEEEREAKYIRVISSSILALGHVISVASDEVNAQMEDEYAALFKHNKFWKFARHKSPNIRAAVFSLVGTSCQRLPGLLGSVASHACPAVLSALDETEPAVCQQLWAGVLSVVQHIQDCWLHVNVRKAVLPKLWSLLRSGGNGCAAVIFPNLLPFLSRVPSEVIGTGPGFYKEFFSNFLEGLKKDKVLNIASECAAVVTAFMECLRLSLLRVPTSCTGQETGNEVQEYLVKEQLLPLIKMSLGKKSKLANSPLYQQLGVLLSRLSDSPSGSEAAHQSTSAQENSPSGDEKMVLPHNNIRDWFWEGFSSLCHQYMYRDDEESKVTPDSLDPLSHCLVCLKSPHKKKIKQRVAFTESNADSGNSAAPRTDHLDVNAPELSIKPLNSQSEDKDVEKLYDGRLIDLICSICKSCVVQIRTDRRLEHVRLLASVVPVFVCRRLLETLVTHYCELTNGEAPCSSSYEDLSKFFIVSIVLPWVSLDQPDLAQDVCWNQLSVHFVVDIVCGVVRTLPDERQVAVISEIFEENRGIHFLGSLLKKGHQLGLRGLTGWLQSAAAGASLVSLAQSLAPGRHQLSDVLSLEERRAAWKTVEFWLTTDSSAFAVAAESMDRICKSFLGILNQAEERNAEGELPMLLGILQNYIRKCNEGISETVAALEDIFLAVFRLQLASATSVVDESVVETLKRIWQSGLRLFRDSPPPVSDCETLLIKAAALIRVNVDQSETVESLEGLAQDSLKLMQESDDLIEAPDEENSFATRHLWPHLVAEEEEFAVLRLESSQIPWLAAPLINAQIAAVSSPLDSLSGSDACPADKKLTRHQKISLFCARLLKASSPEITSNSTGCRVFIRLLLEMLWIRELYANAGHVPTKDTWFENIASASEDLLLHVKASEYRVEFFTAAFERSKQEGFLWSLVFGAVLSRFQVYGIIPDEDMDVLLSEVQEAAFVEESWCHTLTRLISELDIRDVKYLTERCSRLMGGESSETGFAFILASLSAGLERWLTLPAPSKDAVLELQSTLVGVLDQLLLWKQKNDVMLLLNSPVEDASMSIVSINMAMVKIFKLAVARAPGHIKASHWDFILCCLVGWLQTCEECRSSLTSSLKCLVLCYHVCTLHAAVARFFEENISKLQEASKAASEPENPDATETWRDYDIEDERDRFPPNLLNEWEEFFSATAYGTLLSIFLDYAGQNKSPFDPAVMRLSEALGTAVIFTPLSLLKTHKYERSPLACAGDLGVPPWAQNLLAECVPLLTSHVHGLQFAAYNLLLRVMPELAASEVQKVGSDEKNEASRPPPDILMATLETTSLRMTEILADAGASFGEHLSMSDDFEAQNVSLSLLLAFKLLLRFFTATSQEIRAEYATFLRRNKHVTEFLGIVFRLIPMRMTGVSVRQEYEPVVMEHVTEHVVQELTCSVFYGLLQCMPAIVRQWWNALDKRQSAVVDKFVTSHITPLLCEREIELVENSPVTFENMQVKTRPSAREVAAVYTMDEISMEMVVKLAPNHPLGAVAVESGKRIGVTTSQWRSWMLQLTTFLMHQNGSIMDGLVLWKRNVDKRFEGVDDCMICFSVIHGTNYSLPKLSCKTCKKKFHSICLYKWFSKSNNSTCPLCRNLF